MNTPLMAPLPFSIRISQEFCFLVPLNKLAGSRSVGQSFAILGELDIFELFAYTTNCTLVQKAGFGKIF